MTFSVARGFVFMGTDPAQNNSGGPPLLHGQESMPYQRLSHVDLVDDQRDGFNFALQTGFGVGRHFPTTWASRPSIAFTTSPTPILVIPTQVLSQT